MFTLISTWTKGVSAIKGAGVRLGPNLRVLQGRGVSWKDKGGRVIAEEFEDGFREEEEVAESQETPDEELKEEEEIEENVVDRIQAALYGFVSSSAGRVERFFDDERYEEEVTTGGVQHTQGALREGENGILLSVRQNGKVVREKMVVAIKSEWFVTKNEITP